MKRTYVFFLCLLLFPGSFIIAEDSLRVHFIDVGEGDAILIQMPGGEALLIDSGNLSAGHTVERYLREREISGLDGLILTHFHPDHVGGAFGVLPRIPTEAVYTNGFAPANDEIYFELTALLQELKIPHKPLKAGNNLSFGPAVVDILSPPEPLTGHLNGDSLALRLRFGDITILLAGDIIHETEQRLIDTGIDLRSNILKIGHHGAKDSCSDAWLDTVKPDIAVLSVGAANRYGYPDPEVVKKFEDRGIDLYRTDEHGTIVLQTDGKNLDVKTEREIKSSLPAKDPTLSP